MRRLLIALFLVIIILDVSAQGMPGGRHGGGGQMGMPRGDRETRRDPPNAAARSVEPYGALERELPSLKVDLMIREEQLESWRTMERDVQDIAEMERARKRHLGALKAGEGSATALTFVSSMAEDDRVKAEAAADFKRHFEALYGRLDPTQRTMLDRRVIQSQDDPLGAENPKRRPG
jgi:hypothetical protein